MSLFAELKRRSVFRVAVGYVGASWLILQVIDVLFGIFEFDTDIDETIVIILAIGFVPAMILAWVFELTPEGIKRDSDTDHDAPAMRDFGRRVDRVIIAILSVAVIFFAVDKFWPTEPATPSIAVLPFDMGGNGAEHDYLSIGMARQLRGMLDDTRMLRVIAEYTTLAYVDEGIDRRTMVDELGLAHIIEGTIQLAGDKVRVTAALVDTAAGQQVWSDSFDRELGDIFEIQDEIAAEVVARLQDEVPGLIAPVSRKVDPEAFRLYLQGSHLTHFGHPDAKYEIALLDAIELLEQAVEIEPEYIDAWLDLTVARYRAWMWDGEPPDDPMLHAADAAHYRAMAIDPDHPVVLAYEASTLAGEFGDPETIAKMYERAIETAPTNADVVRSSHQFIRSIGFSDKAVALAELAVDRDPKCADCYYVLSQAYRDSGNLEEAIKNGEIAMSLGKKIQFSVAMTHLQDGRPEPMLKVLEDERQAGLDDVPAYYWAYAAAQYTAGNMSEFEAALQILEERWGDEASLDLATVYAWSGRNDEAFQWLEIAVDNDRYWLSVNYLSPFFGPVRDDPRWDGLLRRIERHPEQLAHIEFDPDIPEVRR